MASGAVVPKPEPDIPKVPMDYTWAKRLGMVRKPANFISTISDDRGEELRYAGTPISEVFKEDLGVGGVLCLLWFRKRLPPYARRRGLGGRGPPRRRGLAATPPRRRRDAAATGTRRSSSRWSSWSRRTTAPRSRARTTPSWRRARARTS